MNIEHIYGKAKVKKARKSPDRSAKRHRSMSEEMAMVKESDASAGSERAYERAHNLSNGTIARYRHRLGL